MKAKVVLYLASTSNSDVLIISTHYTNNMTGNMLFAATDIVTQVTTTVAATSALRTAMIAATSDTKNDTIRVARETLDRNLTILASKVETVANSPSLADDQRVGVIHSAGMEVKTQGTPRKRAFTAFNGDVEGSVYLIAPGGANAHEWQYTTDLVNFTGRVAVDSTTKSNTEINGLKSGTRYAFFHKPIVANENTDWEGPFLLTLL